MKRVNVLGVAALAVLAALVPAIAQQSATAPTEHAMVLPSVDQHVKVLSEKLGLTEDQEQKARPIIAEMQDAMQTVIDDKSMTHEEAQTKIHQIYMKADKELRSYLTDEQKTKLDEMEAEQRQRHEKH